MYPLFLIRVWCSRSGSPCAGNSVYTDCCYSCMGCAQVCECEEMRAGHVCDGACLEKETVISVVAWLELHWERSDWPDWNNRLDSNRRGGKEKRRKDDGRVRQKRTRQSNVTFCSNNYKKKKQTALQEIFFFPLSINRNAKTEKNCQKRKEDRGEDLPQNSQTSPIQRWQEQTV